MLWYGFIKSVIFLKGIYMVNNIVNKSKEKITVSLITLGIIAISSTGCNPSNTPPLFGGGSDFNLQGLMITRINTDSTSVSSTLSWNQISSAKHYELSRIQDNGSETNIGPSTIDYNITTYLDVNLQQDLPYKYIIRAYDANNKQILKSETSQIKPISALDLKATEIQGLKPPPDSNTVASDINLKWSTVENTDLYYASIVNNLTNEQVFGVFTTDSNVNLNVSTSPKNPSEIIKKVLPIYTNGLQKEVRHKFTVYTIKANNADIDKATAIGIRQSKEVLLLR